MKDYNSIILPPINGPQQEPPVSNQKPTVLLPLPTSNSSLWDYKVNNGKPAPHYIHNQDEVKAESLKRLRSVSNLGSESSFSSGYYNNYNNNYNNTYSRNIHSPLPVTLNSFSNDKMLDAHPVLPPLVSKPSPLSSPSSQGRTSSLPSNSTTPLSRNHSLNDFKVTSQDSRVTKPRKKKQCPECRLFFSNLSTHKSTHLPTTNRPFQCRVCSRGFSRSNDLFRHEKRHWKELGNGTEDAYKCPFSVALLREQRIAQGLPIHDLKDELPCHSSGIFSRCDTYKNHLKALHFEYPPGTKKKFRNGMHGKCKKCGQGFQNVDDWLNNHIETGQCGYKF